ncbi:conjugal transfer protein MobC [Chitinophaga varians]|uniref:conjugal transfer protein MobC n=1 Tax=Chitinophaga varians TaxID=2202339 RepID=UPI00165F754D|nr:conjugal transfer protein MobC [Chitinophaga varians]MBC9909111.1 type IV secretion system DNA-binding domain-containing protein [Chitinophaga varians]
MQTGENVQALQSIINFIRLCSIIILLIHYYATCYSVVQYYGISFGISDRIIYNLSHSVPFLSGQIPIKISALLLLSISLIGTKGKKNEKLTFPTILFSISIGFLLYFISSLCLLIPANSVTTEQAYIVITSAGYLSILSGVSKLSRLLRLKYNKDVFNEKGQSFPQCEKLIETEYSVNIPATYILNGRRRNMYINNISVFRSTIILGSPGSGKTYYFFSEFIKQHIEKQFCLFIFDYKFPDLTKIAYNHLLKHVNKYPIPPKFFILNFDDLSRTHRCNTLPPDLMEDITDATESSRTFMLALNKEWQRKEGEFFTESAINFCTALFWFLKKYKNGLYCTLPHAIELSQIEYEKLFPVLSLEPEIHVLINPFISALKHKALEQLEGQVASAKIAMARLSSPSLYYVLSGSDFSLDINNPQSPKIICAGSNPAKQKIYSAVLSLYIERMLKLVNQKKKTKSAIYFDEFPTIYVPNIDSLIATARSNKVATVLGVQDMSQLVKNYGKESADVIMNIAGNVICGQVNGETARQISDRIGKTLQVRESLSINSSETSLSRSTQLEFAIPPSKIATLSSGEFVGIVGDEPTNPIQLKAFHAIVTKNHEASRLEEMSYVDLPIIRNIDNATVHRNYLQVKQDIQDLIDREIDRIKSSQEYQQQVHQNQSQKETTEPTDKSAMSM